MSRHTDKVIVTGLDGKEELHVIILMVHGEQENTLEAS